MFITADQLLCHMIGDYILQTDYMAQEKTKKSLAAALHAGSYTLPFLFLTQSPMALAFIAITHFLIDRFRLAKYVCWAKNQVAPKAWRYPLSEGSKFGYRDEPFALNIWLLIIADNTLHWIMNGIALKFFV